VGFKVCGPGPTATWLYYLVDQAKDALHAKETAMSMAGDEIDAPCLRGSHRVGGTEISLLRDDGVGPRRLLRCAGLAPAAVRAAAA
jgi:hypothetical protein